MVTIKLDEKQAEILHNLTRDYFLKMQDEVAACKLTTPPNVRRIMEVARDEARDLAALVDASIECEETQDSAPVRDLMLERTESHRAR